MYFNKLKVNIDLNIREALKQMDIGGRGIIICVDSEDNVIGIITDGDFRRAILKGISLDDSVRKIVNESFIYLNRDYLPQQVIDIFQNTKAQHIPIIHEKKLIDLVTEESFYKIKKENNKPELTLPVVIMAGGKGTRLDPFTKILPKPLIPVNDKAIIERIMEEFSKNTIGQYYVSINYKSEIIKAFFKERNLPYTISFIHENKPLGTAGALKFVKGNFDGPFFVSNCDIIVKDDYTKIYDFHKKNKYSITIVASMQHYKIPFGICQIENGGQLKLIEEKPEYDFLVNTGVYILNSEILDFIPDDQYFDMTDLIRIVKDSGKNVGVYPISQNAWLDVGQWMEYKKAVDILPQIGQPFNYPV